MAVDAPGTSRQYPVLPETRDWITPWSGKLRLPGPPMLSHSQWVLLSVESQNHKATGWALTAPNRASRHIPVARFSNLKPLPPVEIGSHNWSVWVKVGSQ